MLWRRLAASILCWERLTDSYALIAIKKKLTTKDTKVHKGKPLVKFSNEFEARFADMLTHYPTKRSVLVPTLLYAQDEVGYLNHEVIHEIAQRLELTDLEVSNVISYYSMLTTKPRGKFNVQVCTNIACMLRGGEELLDHCKSRLGIGHKGTTPDGMFSLEEVECIGACSWAPAVQVNYDFHENLTAEKIDKILDGYKTN
jgi:NADH-quinone oxidoreductase subunit E